MKPSATLLLATMTLLLGPPTATHANLVCLCDGDWEHVRYCCIESNGSLKSTSGGSPRCVNPVLPDGFTRCCDAAFQRSGYCYEEIMPWQATGQEEAA